MNRNYEGPVIVTVWLKRAASNILAIKAQRIVPRLNAVGTALAMVREVMAIDAFEQFKAQEDLELLVRAPKFETGKEAFIVVPRSPEDGGAVLASVRVDRFCPEYVEWVKHAGL